jgi:hypothetical protein
MQLRMACRRGDSQIALIDSEKEIDHEKASRIVVRTLLGIHTDARIQSCGGSRAGNGWTADRGRLGGGLSIQAPSRRNEFWCTFPPRRTELSVARSTTLTKTLRVSQITAINYKEPTLHFESSPGLASYDGTMNKDHSAIAGTWKQGGTSLSLILKLTP